MSRPIIENPLVLDPSQSYTFRSYFEMRFSPIDILHDFGCTLTRKQLQLPEVPWDVSYLRISIEGYLPYTILTSEDIRKQALIGPIMLNLAKEVQSPLQGEYPITADPQFLKGDLDYYLETNQGLLVVEAKNADLARGFVQLAVELIALYQWRLKGGHTIETHLTGCVTTGEIWQFGQYYPAESSIVQDIKQYQLPDDLEQIAAILKGVVTRNS